MLSHLHMSCVILFHFPWNILILLEYLLRKMSDFVSIPLFGFTLVTKLRNFDFESHWNILIFFDKRNILRQIWIFSMEKSVILFHFHRSWKSLQYFNIFVKKDWRKIWICPIEKWLILFYFRCLGAL